VSSSQLQDALPPAGRWPRARSSRLHRRTASACIFATSEQGAKARGLLGAVTQGLKEYGWDDCHLRRIDAGGEPGAQPAGASQLHSDGSDDS
jgi:hypothetical protein